MLLNRETIKIFLKRYSIAHQTKPVEVVVCSYVSDIYFVYFLVQKYTLDIRALAFKKKILTPYRLYSYQRTLTLSY